MKPSLKLMLVSFIVWIGSEVQSQGNVSDPYFDSSCNAGGEVWVCGRTEVLQVHSDFQTNCGDWDYTPCTVLKTVIDYCTPNLSESRIFEEGGPDCPLNSLQ